MREHYSPEGERAPRRRAIVALIPAWNSGQVLADSVAALRAQTLAPDRILIVANNCTDDTVEVARGTGAEVMELPVCRGRKAGALNVALRAVLPELGPGDFIVIQDDDTRLGPDWIANALRRLSAVRRPVHAVGATFHGRPGGGVIGALQRNEYVRFAQRISRQRGNIDVLSGTATMFCVPALRAVRAARATGSLPGRGYVYNEASLTEDHDLTLALHRIGYRTTAPAECLVVTDVMLTLTALWHQRIRWQRGTLEDLFAFGWNRLTVKAFARQGLLFGTAMFTVAYSAYVMLQVDLFSWSGISPARHPWWLAAGAFLAIERAITVRSAGTKAMALAACLVPEYLFDLFRQAVFFAALAKAARRVAPQWITT